ncbi:dimodular nonribosomal peptide synthase isoform X1 [Nasonia vitripennis]|uniref:Ebony n=1 Tax=Nasonia vitripennis TaxID=7425 RepID=A0A7M7GEG5_NASVI|nr:dimodular nonribosomal peptide synthase isoform X1 [Nasonia vitripennis]
MMEASTGQSVLTGESTKSDGSSFFSLLKRSVSENPERIALLFEDDEGHQKSLSYKALDETSNRIANLLRRYSKRRDGIIAVSLKPSEKLPLILLSILKAGISYLPIDVEFPVDRVQLILRDAQPVLCILEETADSSVYNDVLTLTVNDVLLRSEHESVEIAVDENIFKIAIILYTSGSTGTPKGVRLPYTALLNRLAWQWKTLPYASDEDFCIFKTALTFVDSVCEIWGPLLQGRTLVVISRHVTKDPERFTAALNKYKIQRIVLVPSLLKSLLIFLRLQQDKRSLGSLKLWVCSGETLVASLVQEFFNWFMDEKKTIANFYGSTEIMGDVTYHLINKDDPYLKEGKIPIGKPVDNCIVYIVDQQLHLVAPGEVGELLIAGKNLADGYIHDSNSHKFMQNPFSSKSDFLKVFRTGDFARISDGLLFYEGRQDTQVKIRGYRVDLSEIEKAVVKLPVVKDAVVLAFTSDTSEQVLLCFIVPKQTDKSVDAKDIKQLLEQSLVSYMIPEIILTDNIPLLINGKTDRQKLLGFYKNSKINGEAEKIDFNYNNVPITHMMKAKILFSTIASTIGISDKRKISVDSNFYELGGNSLNSVYTVLKLREKGFHIGITDFITSKSIKDILFKLEVDSSSETNEDVNPQQYVLEMLNDSHKKEVINMITESFITKADLERWLLPDINKEDYTVLMEQLWVPLLEKNFSFVLKSPNNELVSVALNFDARDEPEVVIHSKLNIIFDFLEHIEQPVREQQLPKGKNKIFHTFMMATGNELAASENVIVMRLMEQHCLEVAKKNNFAGILTTNTSPLTQQLGTDVFNYKVMLDYQVNRYVTPEGSKPFAKAPDDQRAVVSWKEINYSK